MHLAIRILLLAGCAKAFQAPATPLHRRVTSPRALVAASAEALQPGDRVAVIGASGNVGKLLALRLAESFEVVGVARDPSRVRSFLPEDKVKLVAAELTDPASLEKALEGAVACVICTGTTAFPTQAWSKKSSTDGIGSVVLKKLIDNDTPMTEVPDEQLNAVEIVQRKWQAMISSLDAEAYNTPKNVDELGTYAILKAWEAAAGPARKRMVMLSSIGVQRRTTMPFPVLNACGVLDAKAAGEEAIMKDAKDAGYSYTIVRPGQLFGGPYDNNYYLGTLFQLDKDAKTQDVEVGRGDELLGDTLRSTLAEVTAQAMESGSALDLDFAVINTKGDSPSIAQVRSRLGAL